MSPLTAICPSCGHKKSVPEWYKGRQLRCPKCRTEFIPRVCQPVPSESREVPWASGPPVRRAVLSGALAGEPTIAIDTPDADIPIAVAEEQRRPRSWIHNPWLGFRLACGVLIVMVVGALLLILILLPSHLSAPGQLQQSTGLPSPTPLELALWESAPVTIGSIASAWSQAQSAATGYPPSQEKNAAIVRYCARTGRGRNEAIIALHEAARKRFERGSRH